MTTVRPPRRGASEEERALFRNVMKDVTPLPPRVPFASRDTKPVKAFTPPRRIPRAPLHPDASAPAIGGHDEARLRRGRGEPEARLDLHGLTHDGAYRALMRFVLGAQAEGKRLVLVITGKGGVLRAYLPLWLGQPDVRPLIGGVSEAHAKHGGSGAFYVSLRKKKSTR